MMWSECKIVNTATADNNSAWPWQRAVSVAEVTPRPVINTRLGEVMNEFYRHYLTISDSQLSV